MSRRKREPAIPRVALLGDRRGSALRRLLQHGPYLLQHGAEGAEIVIWTPAQAGAEPIPVGAALNVLDLRGVPPGPATARR